MRNRESVLSLEWESGIKAVSAGATEESGCQADALLCTESSKGPGQNRRTWGLPRVCVCVRAILCNVCSNNGETGKARSTSYKKACRNQCVIEGLR